MNSPVENIVQHLFKTISLQNVSAEQLQQAINDHPYNGAAYFLLAKKLYATKEMNYEEALQKAALHFSNNMWLHFNLNEEEYEITKDNIAAEITETSDTENETKNFDNIIVEPVNIDEEKIVTDQVIAISTELIQDKEELKSENTEADDAVAKKLSSMLQQQASDFEKPIEATDEVPVESTPYHRVDYFDSQGIKLEAAKSDDKLGTQLKRFTDWLKQMKHENLNPAALDADEAGELKVQNMAAHSNENEEIATETMAEVLIKQGKPEQAIQIYEKLSFINHSKSAYFAAKIQELKD
ncbi:MAG: hypothetical protein ABJB05_08025 [Parafilimonas sp.]